MSDLREGLANGLPSAGVGHVEGRTAHEIFGSPDDLKFRSSMTLFEAVADDPTPFERALEKYYDGEPDPKTLELLAESGSGFGASRSGIDG